MKRVTGIGGAFFQAHDAAVRRAGYRCHQGIGVEAWGGAAFIRADAQGRATGGMTVRSVDPKGRAAYAPDRARSCGS